MNVYAVVETIGNLSKLLLVTDCEKMANEELERVKLNSLDKCANYTVLRTDNFVLSAGAVALISEGYDRDCLEETVRNRLEQEVGDGKHPEEYEALVKDIANKAYHEMIHYGISEEYAIDEAFEAFAERIEQMQEAD